MNKKKLGILLSMVMLLGVGCEKEVAPVESETTVQPKTLTREARGTVVVQDRTSFYIDFPATIEEVYVKEGEVKQIGDKLFRLNRADYDTMLAQQKLQLALYNEEVEGLEAVANVYAHEIKALQDRIATESATLEAGTNETRLKCMREMEWLQTQRDVIMADYEDAQALVAVGGIAQDSVETLAEAIVQQDKLIGDATNNLEAQIKLEEETLKALQTELQTLQLTASNEASQRETTKQKLGLQIETLALDIEVLEAKLKKDYIQDDYIIATTPNTVLSNVALQKGTHTDQVIGAAFETMQLDTRVIVADVPEAYSDELAVGDTVTIIPYTDEDTALKGSVVRMSEEAVENYGEIIVKTTIEIEDEMHDLRVGSSVDITF